MTSDSDDSDSFSRRAVRRARIDLIFRDYEVSKSSSHHTVINSVRQLTPMLHILSQYVIYMHITSLYYPVGCNRISIFSWYCLKAASKCFRSGGAASFPDRGSYEYDQIRVSLCFVC